MRWWILSVFFICPLFALTSPIAETLTLRPTSSDWLTLLHLSDCELPCWIGITPGETTLGEARMRIEATFADPSLYELRGPGPNDFSWLVNYKPMGTQLGITLLADASPQIENSMVGSIHLQAFRRVGELFNRPQLSDLQSVLGEPTTVRLASGFDAPTVSLSYREDLVSVRVDDLECDQVLLSQEFFVISAWSEPPRLAWLSDPQPWQGFNYCYNFVVKIS